MSRYGVTYKPGGAITKPLDLTLKMQREIQPIACKTCTPKPTGLFWQNPANGLFEYTVSLAATDVNGYNPLLPLFLAARLEGELCNRQNDVVLKSTWVCSISEDPINGPSVWTAGNLIIVYFTQPNLLYPGVLTVTSSLDGVITDAYPIKLVVTASGGYY
jgi:hypothetical protein